MIGKKQMNKVLDQTILYSSVTIVVLGLAHAYTAAENRGMIPAWLPAAGGESDYKKLDAEKGEHVAAHSPKEGVKAKDAPQTDQPAGFAVRSGQAMIDRGAGNGTGLAVFQSGIDPLSAGVGLPGLSSEDGNSLIVKATAAGMTAIVASAPAAASVVPATSLAEKRDMGAEKSKAATVATEGKDGARKHATSHKPAPARQNVPKPASRTSRGQKAPRQKVASAKASQSSAKRQMSDAKWCKHVVSQKRNTAGCRAIGYVYTAPKKTMATPAKAGAGTAGLLQATGWKAKHGNIAGAGLIKQLRRDIKSEVKPRHTPPKHNEKQTIAGTVDTATPARTRREAATKTQPKRDSRAIVYAATTAAASRRSEQRRSTKLLRATKAEQKRKAARQAWLKRKAVNEAAERVRLQKRAEYLGRKAAREKAETERRAKREAWLKRQAAAKKTEKKKRLDIKFCDSLLRQGLIGTGRGKVCRSVYGYKVKPTKAAKTHTPRKTKKAASSRAHSLTKREKDARYCKTLKAPHLNRTCRIEHGYKSPKSTKKHKPLTKRQKDAAYCARLKAPHKNKTCRIEHGYKAPVKRHQPRKVAKAKKQQTQAQKDKAYCKTLGGNAWKNKVCRNSYGFKKPRKKAFVSSSSNQSCVCDRKYSETAYFARNTKTGGECMQLCVAIK